MALIDDVKIRLHIKPTTTAYDPDVMDLIESAKADLSVGGVEIINETDPLTKQAIKLYCQANFGYDEDSEKFAKAYDGLKISMALCGDYKAVV